MSGIQEAEEVFATTMDDLEQLAKEENIEIFNRQIFKDDPKAAIQNLKRQVSALYIMTALNNLIGWLFHASASQSMVMYCMPKKSRPILCSKLLMKRIRKSNLIGGKWFLNLKWNW